MPIFLDFKDQEFEIIFQRLVSMKREDSPDVDQVVGSIISEVRKRGDAALIEFTKYFDRLDLTTQAMRISDGELEDCVAQVNIKERNALELAASRIREYHKKQFPKMFVQEFFWRYRFNS